MKPTTIAKLLVANRGEIAIRILRACAELDIKTVAIYTYEDRYSLHRYKADEAYQVGEDDDPLKPYLDINAIIRIAKNCGAGAIHPGYGFLSENFDFARKCRDNGIIFVGPDPEVMQQLGDKVMAKEIARRCNVPLIESNAQPLTDIDTATKEAARIGYPIMLKAAAGGGAGACAWCAKWKGWPKASRKHGAKPRTPLATTPCSSRSSSTSPATLKCRSSPTATAT